MKTGLFTTEFLVTIVGGILTVIADALKLDPAITTKIVALVIAYVTSRTVVKVTNGKK